ncbi:MAG TPA: sulfite exporter TauE/SafE family protein [Candidatus Limnocylindria bacterium]
MTPDQIGELAGLAAVGLGAGFLAGLLGIGGGVVMVPAMVLLFGFDQHVAQGTSLLVIIPAALTGSYTHHRRGRLVLRDAALLAAGGVVGAVIGSVFALSLEDAILRRLFAAVIIVTALRMLLPKRWFQRAVE